MIDVDPFTIHDLRRNMRAHMDKLDVIALLLKDALITN